MIADVVDERDDMKVVLLLWPPFYDTAGELVDFKTPQCAHMTIAEVDAFRSSPQGKTKHTVLTRQQVDHLNPFWNAIQSRMENW